MKHLLNKLRLATVALALLLGGDARAEWKTETFDLVPGWNSIYLHIDPSHEDLEVLLQRTPVSQVWMWAPSSSTAQFVTSVQDDTDFGSSWLSWEAADSANSQLQKFIGNAGYLVYVETTYHDGSSEQNVSDSNPFTLSLIGRAVPPSYTWTASGQNFIGFSTRSGSEPSFENFFALAETLDTSATEVYQYVGGELGTSNPLLVDAPINTAVTRGQAFWVRDSDYNRFFSPFAVSLQDSSGVHFGNKLSGYSIRLQNNANIAQTVTLEIVASDAPADGTTLVGTPPILVRGELSSTDFTYSFADLAEGNVSWDLAASGEIGSSVEIVLGIDRAAMSGSAGDLYGGILRLTDSFGGSGGYSQIDLPVTAEVASLSGLWVGEAKITQVQQDLTEYEVDDDGATALNDDGSSAVSDTDLSYGGVARSYSLRLIMHVDDAGQTRLLQRVYYGLDADTFPMLATQQGLLNAEHLDVARRITAVHLPWTETNTVWEFDTTFGLTSTMNTSVGVGYADTPSNPFLHIYHPDHDNKDAEFSTTLLDRGYESFDIVRDITLNAGSTLVTSDSSTTTTTSSSDTSTDTDSTVVPELPSGIQMLDIPRGSFVMGDATLDSPVTTAPIPERTVNMSAFEMSEAEVTVQQYVDYLNAAMASGLISVATDVDGTFVFGASGQPYEGLKFIELSGTRVLKDHDGDGDIDPENPLNQCWIEFDGTSTFSVKDPQSIDWENYSYVTDRGLAASEWSTSELLVNTAPALALDGAIAANAPRTVSLSGGDPQYVVSADGIVYVANAASNNITILDASDPATITVLKVLQDGVDGDELNGVNHLTLSGTRLIALANASGDRRVSIYDVSTPSAPVRMKVLNSGNTINDADGTAHSFNHGIYYCSVVDGDNLYIAGTTDRVTILNIADPTTPVWVYEIVDNEVQADGQSINVGNVRSMQIVDNVAYFGADQGNRISIVDVTDPTRPVLLSELIDGSNGYDADVPVSLGVADGVLYFLDQSANRVTLVDVGYSTGSPGSPVKLIELSQSGFSDTLEAPDSLAVANNRLYVASSTAGALTVIDVADPASPTLLQTLRSSDGTYPDLAGANWVTVDGADVYVTADTAEALSVLETFQFAGAQDMVVADGVAYVANYSSGTIAILDVSDPVGSEFLGELEHGVNSERLSGVNSLTRAGNLLFATAWFSDTISIYDITDRANPVRLAQIIDNSSRNLHRPITTAVGGDYLYISNVGAGDADAITIVNIADPTDPQIVAEIIHGAADIVDSSATIRADNVSSMLVDDDVLYAATAGGITIMNVKDPANPVLLTEVTDGNGGFNHASSPNFMLMKDDVLYFGDASESAFTLARVEVTHDDAGVPTAIALEKLAELQHGDGTYSALEGTRAPFLDENLLYLPAETSGALTVVDVSDPANPTLLEELINGEGDYAYLSGLRSVAVGNNSIYLMSREVNALTIATPSNLVGETIADWPELESPPGQSEVANWPATFIKWHGAKAFAEYYGCDLPTEAQWEYAAKANGGYAYATVDGSIDATRANYNENDVHPDPGHVVVVKSYAPNPFGLYDMSGNVWEWCRDWFNPDFYHNSPNPDTDPYNDALYLASSEPVESTSFVGGPGQDYNGDTRIRRGGSWNYHTSAQASSNRERDYTWRGNDHFGFRIVRESFRIATADTTSFTARTSSSTKLSGVYQEKITLKGKDDEAKEYNIAGEFSLIRISDIDQLQTQ